MNANEFYTRSKATNDKPRPTPKSEVVELMEAYHKHKVKSITEEMISDTSYHYTNEPNPLDFRTGAKWFRDQLKQES